MRTFEELIEDAASHEFTGWDFSFIEDRIVREGTPWSYAGRVDELAGRAHSLVDLGTGGGEFLADISPRPPCLVATEGWMPNVPVAAARLRPLGTFVVAYEGPPDNADQTTDTEERLPFQGEVFDVVINRHEA